MALLRANRDVLLVLAGLFFLIPQMILGMALPEVPQGLEGEAATKAALAIFGTWWPLVIGVSLVQAVGVLVMMILLTGSARPTVREAMVAGLKALPPYIAATLILAAGVGLVGLLIIVPLALIAGQAAAGIALLPILIAALWLNIRTLPLAPVIAAEGECNPFEALQRTWRMTVGHGGRLLLLVVLFVLAALVISVVTTAVPGSILIATLGQEAGTGVVGVIEAVVSTALMLVWSVVLVAVYRQLASPAK